MRKGGNGMAVIAPTCAEVGKKGSFTITYTVGPLGMIKGGGFKVMPPWGGGMCQTEDPGKDGYVTVLTNGNAKLNCYVKTRKTMFYQTEAGEIKQDISYFYICVEVKNGRLYPGDYIILRIEDLWCPFCAQKDVLWEITDSPDGADFEPISTRGVYVNYYPGSPAKVKCIIPSWVSPGQPFSVRLVTMDSFHNLCPVGFPGNLRLGLNDFFSNLPDVFSFQGNNRETFRDISVSKTGVGRIEVMDRSGKVITESNPILSKKSSYSIFWGNLHHHTNLFDAVGTPSEAYQFARDVAMLDFCAITEHEHHAGGEAWEEIITASKTYNCPGKFVTFPAYEWTSRFWGHRNIYFLSEEEAFLYPLTTEWDTPNILFEELAKNCNNALVIPHHMFMNMNFDYHNPRYEKLVEVYSIWGSCEYRGNPIHYLPDRVPGRENLSLYEVLKRAKVGIIASGDTHYHQCGQVYPENNLARLDFLKKSKRQRRDQIMCRPGLVAVLAEELTRESIWEALNERRCYGTTGERIIIDFKINGQVMGMEVDSYRNPLLEIDVHGTDAIEKVCIIKNSREIYTYKCNDKDRKDVSFKYEDKNFVENSYYYVRVQQVGLNFGWSSPIWVRKID